MKVFNTVKGKVLIILFMAVIFLFTTIKGVLVLTAKKNSIGTEKMFDQSVEEGQYVTGKVYVSSGEYLELSHTMNLIPTGKEHFFLIFNEDMTKCISVRADKDFAEQFNSNTGMSLSGVQIDGVIKEIDYYKIKDALENTVDIMNENDFYPFVSYYYIDCLADRYAYLSITEGILTIIIFGFGAVVIKMEARYLGNRKEKPVMLKCATVFWIAALIAYFILMIHLSAMID